MAHPTRIEVNCSTGEQTIHELTADEIAQRDADAVASLALQAERDASAKTLADAKADLLAKLGITADEAKLLIS